MFKWERNFNALKEYKNINGKNKDPSSSYKHVVRYGDGKEEEGHHHPFRCVVFFASCFTSIMSL